MASEDEHKASDTDLPKEGDVLAGKYRIDKVLGQGGMGVVVAAHHTALRQKVAVKFLLPSAANRGDAGERFLREARAAVSIQSEHVARVTDVGTLESGAPYMVMELLSGADLGDVLTERGPLPIVEAVDYVLQACEALAEAHALGLIHRDLKPANMFLTTRADGSPLVKVLDFGLAKATKPDTMDASLTATNVVMGSPYYMSPEQIRSFKSTDVRSDVWAVGVILYELLTGTRPFEGESMGALFMAIGSDPVPSMRDLRPEIPPELEAAVRKCLVKDVTSRTQSIAELADALAPFGDEDSHISVERISRVLSTPGSLPRGKTSGRISKLPQGSGAVAAVTAPAPAATSPSVTSAAAPVVGAAPVLKSGSMPALALSDGGAPAVAPPRKRGGAIAVGVVVLAGAVGAAAVFGLRDRKAKVTAEPVPSSVVAGAAATSAPGAASSPSSAPAGATVDPAAPAAAAGDPLAADPRGGAAAGLGLRPGLKKGATPAGSAAASAPANASAAPAATGAPAAATAAPSASASAAAAPAAPAEAPLPEAYQDLPEYAPPAAGANPLAASASPAAGSPKPIKKGKLPPRRP